MSSAAKGSPSSTPTQKRNFQSSTRVPNDTSHTHATPRMIIRTINSKGNKSHGRRLPSLNLQRLQNPLMGSRKVLDTFPLLLADPRENRLHSPFCILKHLIGRSSTATDPKLRQQTKWNASLEPDSEPKSPHLRPWTAAT